MEMSRDLTNVIGIAGFSDEKLRVYRTTMSPFGAPDWDHTPFTNKVNVPTAQQCWELTGAKYLSTSMAPSGKAFAYGTADGVYTTAIPDNCAPGGPGTLVLPGAKSPDWGPADVPTATPTQPTQPTQPTRPGASKPKLKLAKRKGGFTRHAHHGRGRQGHADRHARRKRVAKKTVTVGKSGQGDRDLQGPRQAHGEGDVRRPDRLREAPSVTIGSRT